MIFPFTSKLKQLADDELMQRVVRGEDKAFDELYRRCISSSSASCLSFEVKGKIICPCIV